MLQGCAFEHWATNLNPPLHPDRLPFSIYAASHTRNASTSPACQHYPAGHTKAAQHHLHLSNGQLTTLTPINLPTVNVERARELLGVELAALVGESYERAYGDMVRVQQLTELEEVIGYSNALTLCSGDAAAAELHRVQICEMWRGRLKGVQRNVEVWQALLSVRTLVLPMAEDTHTWLKFASLCRKSGRVRWACPLIGCQVSCCAVLCCAEGAIHWQAGI